MTSFQSHSLYQIMQAPEANMIAPRYQPSIQLLTRDFVRNILVRAYWNSEVLQADKPALVQSLQDNIQYAKNELEEDVRSPQSILNGYVKSERVVILAWNKHRLGNAVPGRNALIPKRVEDDLVEDDTSFPLRKSVRWHGVSFEEPPPLPTTCVSTPKPALLHTPKPQSKSKTPQNYTPTSSLTATPTPNSRSTDYDKLPDTPSPNLPFPSFPSNILISEITAFLPQYLKSTDVIDRAISNGGTASTFARMINAYRDMPNGEIRSNTVLRMMQPGMRRRGGVWGSWTVGKHIAGEEHDTRRVDVRGFRTPVEISERGKRVIENIPFRELGRGVKTLPQGYDALDLTRCVAYCLQPEHIHEEWKFPDDFGKLVGVLGGPKVVEPGHYDGAVFARWMPLHRQVATEKMYEHRGDSKGRLLKRSREECEDLSVIDGTPTKKRRNALKPSPDSPPTPSRHYKQLWARSLAVDSDSEADDAFKGSKRADALGRKNLRISNVRRSPRVVNSSRVKYADDSAGESV